LKKNYSLDFTPKLILSNPINSKQKILEVRDYFKDFLVNSTYLKGG